MSSPGGRVIGRVSVKVLPDTSEFRRKAKNQIDRIEKNLGQIKVGLDRQSMNHVENQLKRWADGISPLEVLVRPKLQVGSTTWTERRLEYLTRPRMVPLVPYLKRSAVTRVAAGIGSMVAAASGGRVLTNWLENLWRAFKNLDKAVPIIGGIASAIAGLGAVGITAVSNLAALSVTLAQIGAAGLALPGLFAGMAVGLGITIIAFKDMKKHLPDVYANFGKMAQEIRKNFWAKAADGIRSLTKVYFPQLSKAASGIGEFWGKLAGAIAKPFKSAAPAMFANLSKSIGITNGFADVFANIITHLGLTGSQYLPKLAQWFGNISTKFSNWLNKVSASGELQQFIDNGIQALADLGHATRDFFGIINSIGKAAAAGGGSTLSMFADTMSRVRTVVESPAFQTGLTNAFKSAHEAISAIVTQSGPALSRFFGEFTTTMLTVMPLAGEAIGKALGGVAAALSQPAMQKGLIDFFQGLSNGVSGLLPALSPLGQLLGQLGTTLGNFMTMVGPMLGTAIAALAPIFTVLLQALDPLITALAGGLNTAIQALVPAFTMIGLAVANFLVALTPVIDVMIAALLPVLTQVGTQIAQVLVQALMMVTPLLPVIGALFAALVPVIGQLLAAVLPLIPPLLQLVMQVLMPLIPVITQIVTACLPPMIAAFSGLVQAVIPVLGIVGQLVTLLMAVLAPAIKTMASVMTTMFTTALRVVTDLVSRFASFISRTISDVKRIWSGGWEGIKNDAKAALSNMGSILVDAGKKLIQGLIDGIASMFGKVQGKLTELTDKLPDWKGPAEKDKTLLFNAGQLVIEGFTKGLESRYDAVRKSLGGLTDSVANTQFRSPAMPSIAGGFGGIESALAAPQTGLFSPGGTPVEINIPTQTDADPEDIADALLYAIRRVNAGGVYATRKG